MDYSNYMNDIERAEYKNFYPLSKLHINDPNKEINFNIDFGDGFCSSEFQFYISGKLVKKADGSDYAAKSTIKLIDNFVPYLFKRITVRKHNKIIEDIENVGILSTVKGTLTYSQSDTGILSNGFKSEFESGGKFEAIGNLSHFGLGFFENVKIPIYKGGFNISFIRAEDDDSIYKWKTGTNALPDDGKIIIEEFFIRVPILDFKTTKKIELVNELVKMQNVLFGFNHWQCIEKTGISGTNFNFDITNIYRNIDVPKFIFIVFQSDRSDKQDKDPSDFDSLNVKNYRVKVNGVYYPDELQNLNINDKMYRIAYLSYQDYKKSYYKNDEMFYEPDEFITERPIYAIDTSRNPINISSSKNDIIISVDFQNSLSSTKDIKCFVTVISKKVLAYDIIKNDIRELK